MTKEKMLRLYREVKQSLGRQPNCKEYIRETGVSNYMLTKKYRRYSNLVREAGDIPLELMIQKHPMELFYETYGNFLRKHKIVPRYGDWIYHEMRPTVSAYLKRLGVKWSGIPVVYYSWAEGKPEWEDTLAILKEGLPAVTSGGSHEGIKKMMLSRELYESIPPVLHDLIPLAHSEGSPYEFESRCALAFRMLGFDVRELGRGSGRNPDGIAKDRRGRYAIIYDAKSRKEYYTTGTDDRQFTEYIKEHKKALASAGYDMVFFLIISGRFGNMLPAPLNRIKLETGVTASYITAENLLWIVAIKTTEPNKYEMGKVKELLVSGGEVANDQIKSAFII